MLRMTKALAIAAGALAIASPAAFAAGLAPASLEMTTKAVLSGNGLRHNVQYYYPGRDPYRHCGRRHYCASNWGGRGPAYDYGGYSGYYGGYPAYTGYPGPGYGYGYGGYPAMAVTRRVISMWRHP
ncbi:MAG: hypothetical protein WBX25_07340 [Rhodomicrobium sp.]